MPRFRVALLIGLLLAGSALAQNPAEDGILPAPTPVAPGLPEEAPAASSNTDPVNLAPSAGDPWRFWVNADYGLGWIRGKALPPLVTTSPPGTAQTAAGVVGVKGTSDVIGGTPITEAVRSVGRVGMGFWFDPEKTLGLQGGFFVAQSKGATFGATSDSTTILARPFTDAVTTVGSSVLVAFPGVSSGSVNVSATMQTFWGANVDLRETVVAESWGRLESLIGYRYLHYGESLDMQQNLLAIGGAFIPGTKIASSDSFMTRNDFHACEFGFQTEVFQERWSLEILTKLAVGDIRREVTISGGTQTTVPGAATTTGLGGVYALSSNIGTRSNRSWVVAPEVGLNLGFQLTENVRLRLGYSFLFLGGIARAADQIDFTLNQNLFPPAVGGGPNRPAVSFAQSDIWLQSINAGVEFRY